MKKLIATMAIVPMIALGGAAVAHDDIDEATKVWLMNECMGCCLVASDEQKDKLQMSDEDRHATCELACTVQVELLAGGG
ncbi:MAG: hypothetical protein OXL38_17540 [Gammaproteobacteria bacterium]|nr:hypothetical protein [Gammaproteobacteria bacterium]